MAQRRHRVEEVGERQEVLGLHREVLDEAAIEHVPGGEVIDQGGLVAAVGGKGAAAHVGQGEVAERVVRRGTVALVDSHAVRDRGVAAIRHRAVGVVAGASTEHDPRCRGPRRDDARMAAERRGRNPRPNVASSITGRHDTY